VPRVRASARGDGRDDCGVCVHPKGFRRNSIARDSCDGLRSLGGRGFNRDAFISAMTASMNSLSVDSILRYFGWDLAVLLQSSRQRAIGLATPIRGKMRCKLRRRLCPN
jgi:hypothetical protein